MSRVLTWIGVVLGALALLFVGGAVALFGLRGFGFMPMARYGFRRPPMAYGGYHFIGAWLPILLVGLFALGVIALLVLGGYAIGRSGNRSRMVQAPQVTQPVQMASGASSAGASSAGSSSAEEHKPAVEKACPNCGKAVQADWSNCPYCGEKL